LDKDAFIAIIEAHQKLIYKVCHLYCQDPHDREDLQQEIIIQLWTSIHRYNGSVKLSTWIYKVALNTAIVYYKKERRHRAKNLSHTGALWTVVAEIDASDEMKRIELLHYHIQQLNETDKAIMLLYLDNTRYQDIAQIVGITETNVATKISRLKHALKKKLKKHINK